MSQSFSNNATTTLNGNITSGATTLSPASASGFPTSGNNTIAVFVQNANGTVSNFEFMLVTAGQGTTTWTLSRGQEGTAAVSHTSGESIVQMWTLAGLNSLGDGFWPFLRPSGLTGAVTSSRYVGGTAGGPPLTGTFSTGDWVNDTVYGVFWTCVSGGSPGSWKPSGPVVISDQTLGSAAASISITVPTAFVGSALEIELFLRSTAAALDSVNVQFNGNTVGTAYSAVGVQGNGTTASSGSAIGTNSGSVGDIPGANSTANVFSATRLVIPNYGASGPSSWTAVWGALGPVNGVGMNSGVWTNSAPLTTLLFTTQSGSTLATGSRVTARVLP